ncbi:MAG: magnesium transporter MgtE [Rhodothermaceae bacterium]|nr:MAG: magnesium transporter MgtE [Rhodothermaceae bacterium]GIV60189.1 MAG: magnesium transporter MgtE [Rhodothermaceae bacterium]
MLSYLLKPEIEDMLREGDLHTLRKVVTELEPAEIADLIENLPEGDDVVLFRILPRRLAASVFEHLPHDKQEALVETLANEQERLADLLNTLSPDDRTAFLEELPGEVAQRLLNLLDPRERETAVRLLGYPEDSVGRLMTTDYVAVRPDWTVEQALRHIRRFGKDSETINVIYVVEGNFRLVDDLRIRELILAEPETRIRELMDGRFVALRATDDQETAIQVFREYDRVALPVTDSEGILLGIVTVDDVLDVAQEEATEDFHKFGSIKDAVLDPLHAGVFFLYRKRILWLFALVLMNVFSGAAIASFEQTIQQVVSLVFFLPLLVDSGGNAGSQSATLMVRALATGDVTLRDWFRLVGKEVLVAFLLGSTMALGVAGVASFRAPEIIMVVALTMVCIVLVGSIVGLSLPFIFTRFGMDPATASAPLITTIADITGVLIYFSIANWYLGLG